MRKRHFQLLAENPLISDEQELCMTIGRDAESNGPIPFNSHALDQDIERRHVIFRCMQNLLELELFLIHGLSSLAPINNA
jgi:hypothetical protein